MVTHAPRAMAGEFLALEPFFEKEGVKLMDIYYIDPTVEDGHMYGIPGDVKWWITWLNKDDLDKAGLPVPPMDWTWDDYKEYAKKLTWGEGVNKHYGSVMVASWMHPNMLIAVNEIADNPLITKDGKNNMDHPAIRDSIQLRYDMEQVEKTQLPLSEMVAMQLDYRSVFLSGRASMLTMATNVAPQIGQTNQFPHDFVTTFATLPIPKGGNKGWTYADNRFYSIGKTSAHPDEAYEYIRWFTTEGLPMKNVAFTAERNYSISIDDMIKGMTAEAPHLFDIEQLTRVIKYPDLFQNYWYNCPAYVGELVNIFIADTDKAVMGEQSIDQALRSIATQADILIAQSKR
jgi:multiple sugar transport system substrate-binding protein